MSLACLSSVYQTPERIVNVKDTVLMVRMDQKTRDELNLEAEKKGLGSSTLARMLILEWLRRERDGQPEEPNRRP